MNQKLKKYFAFRLEEEISSKSIHPYNDELWIVDLIKEEWYLMVNPKGQLFYNQNYFKTYVDIFSLEKSDLTSFLKEWFERNFEIRLSNVSRRQSNMSYIVRQITENKVVKFDIKNRNGYTYGFVKKFSEVSRNKGVVLVEDYLPLSECV